MQRRDALSPALRNAHSECITGRLLALPEFGRAQTVLAYCAFGSELDTEALLRAVLASGQTLLLPKVNRAGRCLDVFPVSNLETQLRAGVWGIREPDPALCSVGRLAQADFVLVPGVAFDRHGGRVGYGQGYYDRLLVSCQHQAHLVAAAFEVQVVEAVPREAHDVLIPTLVTEAGVFVAAGLRAPH